MIQNFLFANLKGVPFLFPVLLHLFEISLGSLANHFFQGMNDILILYHRDLAAFHTAGSFHNGHIAFFHLNAVRIKIVDLAYLLEPNSNYFRHSYLRYFNFAHIQAARRV